MNLAPIVLFVYNRPEHSKQTIEALQKNELAKYSELFIYSDGPKDDLSGSGSYKDVDRVREYIRKIDGFRKVTIIEREKNWGLAASIIDGVTDIINKYGKIIVMEDDLVTSPFFLKFMNDALDFYEKEERVWHITGWNYPIEVQNESDVFLWRLMGCTGWSTWADKWQFYEKDVDKLISEFTRKDIKRFNLDGVHNLFWQVTANKRGKINTWAIFWYATIFKNDGLCVNPARTYVDNIGFDGSGVHSGSRKDYTDILNYNSNALFVKVTNETSPYEIAIKKYLKESTLAKLKRLLTKSIWPRFIKLFRK